MEEHLLRKIQAILEICQHRGLTVFVIGGLSVYAYGSLLRRTMDLDLVVERKEWPRLANILETQGYHLTPTDIWVTATKGEDEEIVEIHIALDDVTDVQSALKYPVWAEPGTQQPLPGLDFTLPVFTLEGLLITKLIALRDNDVVDIVALLVRHTDRVRAEHFWNQAAITGLEFPLENRLVELEELLTSGEVGTIWWDRLGLMLDESEYQVALKVVHYLHNYPR